MKAHFSGYATKAGIKCSDGRTITTEAFQHMDGKTVPLVWQHGHGSPDNVLGHAVLEAREDGVYAYGFFNDTPQAQNARELVKHGDITNLSIYANSLVEKAKQVFHGVIREVSLVLSGANPGALIDNVAIAHNDGSTDIIEDEAVIYTDARLEHSVDYDMSQLDNLEDDMSENEDDMLHAEDDEESIQDVYESLSKKQKDVVNYMIGVALEAADDDDSDDKAAAQSALDDNGALAHEEGAEMNIFDQQNNTGGEAKHELSHDAIKGIVEDAQRSGSLKTAVEDYALRHGINNIDVLFPDAQDVSNTPEWDKRRTEWVSDVLSSVNTVPFSRIRTRSADITQDEARAKGYIKGNLKKEEFFGALKRTTTPTTIYKKQQLDRDDMLDITDFDVVAWLKAEMRLMLDEELARAILIGDGRDVADEDKIKDPAGAVDGVGIRSIINDHEMYTATVNVNIDSDDDGNQDWYEVVKAIMRARRLYKGSGSPTLYTTNANVIEMMLAEDGFGRPRFPTREALTAALQVAKIVEVEVMEDDSDILGVMVNLRDYAVGADKGARVSMFDDFDIDYNKHKYLLEARVSGALTKLRSALFIKRVPNTSVLVTPAEPTYDAGANTVTIVDQTGVEYYNAADDTPMNAAGSPYSIPVDGTLTVYALPAAGYYFPNNVEDQWTYTYEA